MGALRLLPLRLSLPLGAGLGRVIGLCAYGESARMAERLRVALDNPPTTGACWADLGRRFVEFVCAARLVPKVEVTESAKARFGAAAAHGQGVLVATLHLGNWELMAAALAVQGIDFAAVGARPKRSPLHRWLASTRAALGVTVLSPGGGARSVTRRLSSGGTAALFVDQTTGERRRPIRFFHAPAPTPTTYERLLALSKARPLLVWTVRGADGVHRVFAEDVPSVACAESSAGDETLSRRPLDWLTARTEDLIRAHPTQWVWLHDRWGEGREAKPTGTNAEDGTKGQLRAGGQATRDLVE